MRVLPPIAPVNTVVALPAPTPENATMPFMDPAFASAVCRYDLSHGPLKLTVPVSLAYTSVSFYTRMTWPITPSTTAPPAGAVIELDLMTAEQHNQMPEDEDITAADRLIVKSPTLTGLIAIRALAPEPGLMPMARAAVAGAQCRPDRRAEFIAIISEPKPSSARAPTTAGFRCGSARFAPATD